MIWSFWQRSMNPVRRLANSTTYLMALVMWMAHCCHINSTGWKGKKEANDPSAMRGNAVNSRLSLVNAMGVGYVVP